VLRVRSILQEVGRRHVARVALVYAAVAFAALEAADIVIPALGLPQNAIRWVIALALLGFPVTLVLAWVYDLTPQGVIRTKAADEDQKGARVHLEPGRLLLSAVLLLVSGAVLAWGALFTYRWSFSNDGDSSSPPAVEELDPLSIAVLPFADMDSEDGGGFFASGIHEDILNHLSKIKALRVISRTTVLQYRDTDLSAREIGRELGVGSILEGSVRKQDNRIRVVTQLIDTRTDTHIWSETFDREETDIFQVQSEIAQEIAGALQAELSTEELALIQTTALASVSGEALNRYWEALAHWDRRESRPDALRAVNLLSEATAIEPTFALAQAALAQARMWLFWNFPGFQDEAELAREALDRALELAPDAVETRLAQGYFHYYGRGDSQEALRHFTAAEGLKPSDANVIAAIGLILRSQGRWEEAVAAFQRARTVDPRSYNLAFTLGETHFRMREYDEAERVFRQAAALAPDVPATYREMVGLRLAATGDTVEARRVLDELPPAVFPGLQGLLDTQLAYYRRDYRSAVGGTPSPGEGEAPDLERPGGGSMGSPGIRGLRPYERLAILFQLMGDEESARTYADSLLTVYETIMVETEANPGPVQTGVIARAHAKRGLAYAILGEDIRAYFEGSSAVSQLPISVDAFEGAEHLRDLAVVYTLIGELDQAVQQLETALAIPSPVHAGELRLDPLFDPLRTNPRFQALIGGDP
jgi:TolB-like protein/Tfp pilus assembly protein PilF